MKLIDILKQELPKRGGWPSRETHVRQDKDMEICFTGGGGCQYDFFYSEMADDVILSDGTGELSEITREQYEKEIQQRDSDDATESGR